MSYINEKRTYHFSRLEIVFKEPNIEEKTWTIKDNYIVNKMGFFIWRSQGQGHQQLGYPSNSPVLFSP